ncbi:flagellar basal body rod protein FlgC [Sneathiella chinensis]|uniref:Flagellar basal-body rod protein FlgC n=1 Tax=Sneathiella chinensis TaxID=349750 RepID=A0ABQ5U630_9PROT|nr:flagellar basal body rod C-terminal domain-containing protein [Sneathiella chinensis]GLQ07343.1 flagellar basal-body rod protein FlgC [Sneathiella chinensis]
MSSIIGSALAGMQASTRKVSVSASNIANSQTVGTPGGTGDQAAYKAINAVQVTGPNGGPETRITPRDPATSLTYSPDHPRASEQGYVESPNVNVAEELVNSKIAQNTYEANIRTLHAWDQMQQALLDIKT